MMPADACIVKLAECLVNAHTPTHAQTHTHVYMHVCKYLLRTVRCKNAVTADFRNWKNFRFEIMKDKKR